MGSPGLLVPVRFIVTISHLIACLMASYTQEENIIRAIGLSGTSAARAEAEANMVSALGVAYACFAIDLVGLMSGTSMFSNSLNLTHVCLHFFGGLGVCWYILYSWHYATIWYFIVGTNVLPSAFELVNFFKIWFCKTEPY